MMLEKYPDILTVEEVCEILRVGKRSVYEMIRKGELPARKMGRVHRISKKGLIAYVGGAV